ncbi:MAG: DinB family protein [Cyclobacteriaceae bacterium]|nr:DinB family protein [Cyclobacteriaceae bacterium]
MILDSLKGIFERDIEKVKQELSLYRNEDNIWKVKKDIKNSGGNLALHLIGNLKHFIGAVLGQSGYERNRDAEFSDKGIPVHDILRQLDEVKTVIHNTFDRLTIEDLEKKFPVNVFGYEMNTLYFLMHLIAHLNYHLGQINYHRRLLDKS